MFAFALINALLRNFGKIKKGEDKKLKFLSDLGKTLKINFAQILNTCQILFCPCYAFSESNASNFLKQPKLIKKRLPYTSASCSPSLIGLSITLLHHCLSVNGSSLKKHIMDHKSFIEFWIGVPVTIHRLSASKAWIAFACRVLGFLMTCPSSNTIRSHLVAFRGESAYKNIK